MTREKLSNRRRNVAVDGFWCNAGKFSHQRLKHGHLQSEPLGGAVVVQLKPVEAGGVMSEDRKVER